MRNFMCHNPRCSKCRQVLEILKEKAIELEVLDYQKNPLSFEELDRVCTMLQVHPKDIVRTNDSLLEEIDVPKNDNREDWINLLVEYPALLQRPIVCLNGKAVIARPPELVLDLL